MLSTAIDADDGTGSVDLALEVAPYFELKKEQAGTIVAEVVAAVASWRKVAGGFGLTAAETDRVASAFSYSSG